MIETKFTYIEFSDRFEQIPKKWYWRLVVRILSVFIPKGNSKTYEQNLEKVRTWILEIDKESRCPNREIGLDENRNVVLIAPDEKDYGFWTDSNMKLQDFESKKGFKLTTQEAFNKLWVHRQK